VEGVTLVRERDGWYASIRVRVPARELPATDPGSIIGVNVGLRYIAGMSDGTLVENPRGESWSRELQRKQELSACGKACGESAERFSERGARRTKHAIYNDVLRHLERYETIIVHAGEMREAAQGPQCRIGSDKGGYVPVMYMVTQMIRERFGDRVREVECEGISRECSRCGEKHATAFQRSVFSDGRRREKTRCPSCGLREHVDVNAARNLVRRHTESQVAAE